MRKLKVYIAGPYTKGDVVANVREAMNVAEICFNAGLVPFIPHLTHFQHLLHPREYQEWLDYDLEWLPLCDILVRIPGTSSGADKEVEVAKELNMLVLTLDEFLGYIRKKDFGF